MMEDDGALLQLWLQPATATMTTMATSGDYKSNKSRARKATNHKGDQKGRSKREIEDGEEVCTMSALEAKVRAYEPTASKGVQP
jgi:hypothetical protein